MLFLRLSGGDGRSTVSYVIEVAASKDPLPVFADVHSIQQGLMNLCVNARDACQSQGVIGITFRVEHRGAVSGTATLPEGEYVFVEIADEVRERLFQPFSTTKPAGRGTGLGMAQVLALMRQARGSVEVQTALGEGTRVRLIFARAAVSAEP